MTRSTHYDAGYQLHPHRAGYLQPEKVVLWAEKADQEQARVLSRLMAKTEEPQYLKCARHGLRAGDGCVHIMNSHITICYTLR